MPLHNNIQQQSIKTPSQEDTACQYRASESSSMAKPSSTARAASVQRSNERPEKIAATAPSRTTRSTRSQSREPVDPIAGQRVDGEGGSVVEKSKGKRGKKAEQELDTVEEDTHDPELLSIEDQAALIAATNDADDDRRISRHSVMSGTTAKTSFSQEEIGELDHDIIMDDLPRLASTADDLLSLLVPDDPAARKAVWKEIRTPGSRFSKLYSNRVRALDIHRPSFGSQDYVSPSIVLRALFGVQVLEDVPSGPWRPDSIIYKINLTQMLRHLVAYSTDASQDIQDRYDDLSSLITYFPSAIAGPPYDSEAVSMCLALQTQLSIARLQAFRSDPDFDPVRIVRETFYDIDDDGEEVYRYSEALQFMGLSDAGQVTVATNIQAHVQRLTDDVSPTKGRTFDRALGALVADHSWDTFLDHILLYHEHRKTQLERSIAGAGGTQRIVQALMDEVQRTQVARAAETVRKSLGTTSGTPKKAFGKGGIAKLKARLARENLAGSSSTTTPQAPTETMGAEIGQRFDGNQAQATDMDDGPLLEDQPPAMDYDIADAEEEMPDAQTAQQTARSGLASLSRMQDKLAAKNKKRSLMDRQPGAHRIEFDDSQTSQPQSGARAEFQVPSRSSAPGPYHVGSSASQGRKRGHEAMDDGVQDFDPTQDEGFETDPRDTAAADARRKALPSPAARPQRTTTMPDAATNYDRPSGSAGPRRPAKEPRLNPGATVPDMPYEEPDAPDAEMLTGSYYTQAKVMAKQNRIIPSQRRPQQTRTPWSAEEENRLDMLIQEEGGNGVSYTALKKLDETSIEGPEGGILFRRSAEDIRFKARNMKETFVKSRIGLPPNWEHVKLPKGSIEKIRAMGIEYEQDRVRAGVGGFDEA